MNNSSTFTILSAKEVIKPENSYGLLFQCAPDSSARNEAPKAVPLSDLIGEFDAVKLRAAQIARKLLESEPAIRGVQQLSIFEELVIRDLQQIIHAKTLHDVLIDRGYHRFSISADSPLTESLIAVTRAFGEQLVPDVRLYSKPRRFASLRRSFRRLVLSGFDRAVVSSELRQALLRIDPYHRLPRLSKSKLPKGGGWFYSTAYTFTAIGLLYEPWFPKDFRYLVNNPCTGGVPLKRLGRPFVSPYDYAARGLAPSKGEVETAKEAIRAHLAAVPMSEEDRKLVEIYLGGSGFLNFVNRLLPQGLFQTALFERFVVQAAPEFIVVGNPVFEGYLLHAARRAGIPTIVLQHGILGDFCQFIDPPVDHYVVRGQFWRDFLATPAAQRAQVLNPPHSTGVELNRGKRERIVFLTAPYTQKSFTDLSDLQDILRTLLLACDASRAPLTIRVHPMEQVSFYVDLLSNLPEAKGVSIEYSQGNGLLELLSQAAAVVTFCSTTFLDCLHLGVPIISFGWHDFSFKRQIEDKGIFYFAKTLADLHKLVTRSLRSDLPAYSGSTKPFLEPMSEQYLSAELTKLTLKR